MATFARIQLIRLLTVWILNLLSLSALFGYFDETISFGFLETGYIVQVHIHITSRRQGLSFVGLPAFHPIFSALPNTAIAAPILFVPMR